MSENFYNLNANRCYPFVLRTTGRPEDGPSTLLNLAHACVVDAGFVLAAKSGFASGDHTVYLNQVRRHGSTFYFDFASDAPELFEVPLTFTRNVADPDYTLSFTDSGEVGLSESSASGSMSLGDECLEPLWSGFLVSGKMSALALLLPVNGTITRGAGGAVVEPALLQNLAGTYVTRVGLANDDRTRADAPEDCPDIVFPYPTGVIHIHTNCVVGDLVFVAGFNAEVRQSDTDNAISFGASVGAGAGQPCDTVARFPGEVPPEGSNLLEGGLRCNEVLRSINGIGGRQFNLIAGLGATIASVPEENKVVVDLNMFGLVTCFDSISEVSESC